MHIFRKSVSPFLCGISFRGNQNVVDIAMGEANYMDAETQAKRTAVNNKRITKWARTENYKLFTDSRKRQEFLTPAFNISLSHICSLSQRGCIHPAADPSSCFSRSDLNFKSPAVVFC